MGDDFDQTKGRIKEAAGDLTGNADLEREGKVDQAVVCLRLAFDMTAPHSMVRPFTVTERTRPPVQSICSTLQLMRMSTPFFSSSASMRPISRSVPPSKVKTPFDMKFEKTMP